jgi:hypothetical protein
MYLGFDAVELALRITAQGHPLAIFLAAIERGNPLVAEMTLRTEGALDLER